MKNGADVTDLDKQDKSALYWAADQNHYDVLMVSKQTIYCSRFLRL